jgi:hypothetical protein
MFWLHPDLSDVASVAMNPKTIKHKATALRFSRADKGGADISSGKRDLLS